MEGPMLARVIQYAPAWVRYVLTLSEIGRSGEGWVLAAGDDIAIMDAGGTPAMPLWPFSKLAEGARADDEDWGPSNPGPQPLSIAALELADKTLPALAENEISVAVFPGPGENRLIGASGVVRDLRAFIDEPRDVTAELELEPRTIELEGWANLNVPDLGEQDADDDARFWLLASQDGASVIAVVADDRPALALFTARATAEDFALQAKVPAAPRAASVNSLIGHWLLMAFTSEWDAAIVTDDGETGAVKPIRLALDLAQTAQKSEAD
ncbi:MAG: DUF2750 domain-containing protein [Coriobacteriia bacterium]